MKTIAIYHKDCTDGTTSAAVVLTKYPDALTFPLSHGHTAQELEDVLSHIESGDRILTVDCVIGVKDILKRGHEVTAIDHHAGCKEEYTLLAQSNPRFHFIFDNNESGSSLTWKTLFPDTNVPELITRVKDQDLWQWKYPDTGELNMAIIFHTNKPEHIKQLLTQPIQNLVQEGKTIKTYADYMVGVSVKNTDPITLSIGPHLVPFYNITESKSVAGNTLAQTLNQTVGLFTINGDRVTISFRSLEHHTPSALDIARLVGGGGHRNASGAAIPLSQFITHIKASGQKKRWFKGLFQ